MNTNERLKKLLDASPEQLGTIDGILERRISETFQVTQGPLLMGMSASAKFLGVSRATLWRMIKAGLLPKVEVLPGNFRLRRADLEAIAAGQKSCRGEAASDRHLTRRQSANAHQGPTLCGGIVRRPHFSAFDRHADKTVNSGPPDRKIFLPKPVRDCGIWRTSHLQAIRLKLLAGSGWWFCWFLSAEFQGVRCVS